MPPLAFRCRGTALHPVPPPGFRTSVGELRREPARRAADFPIEPAPWCLTGGDQLRPSSPCASKASQYIRNKSPPANSAALVAGRLPVQRISSHERLRVVHALLWSTSATREALPCCPASSDALLRRSTFGFRPMPRNLRARGSAGSAIKAIDAGDFGMAAR